MGPSLPCPGAFAPSMSLTYTSRMPLLKYLPLVTMPLFASTVARAQQQEEKSVADSAGEAIGKGAEAIEEGAVALFSGAWGWLQTPLFTVGESDITAFGIMLAILILIITMVVSRLLRSYVERYQSRNPSVSQSTLQSISFIMHYVLIVLGVLLAFVSLGFNLSSLALIAGALGVGVGFGLQTIISNFLSGIIIFFEKSLKVGDYIELGRSDLTGVVREIRVRSTLITTNDNIDILVPNSEFVSGRVTNWTLREASRRLRIPFGVAYGTDKEVVKKAGLEAAAEVSFTLPDTPGRRTQVWLVGFGDSSLDFELVVWINRKAVFKPAAVYAAYNWAIHTALAKYQIEIPFPQRDLYLKSVPKGLQGALADDDSESEKAEAPPELSWYERKQLESNDAAEEVQQQVEADEPVNPDPDEEGPVGEQDAIGGKDKERKQKGGKKGRDKSESDADGQSGSRDEEAASSRDR